jgi:membrane protein
MQSLFRLLSSARRSAARLWEFLLSPRAGRWFDALNLMLDCAAETAFFLLLGCFPLAMFFSSVLTGLDVKRAGTLFGTILPSEIRVLMTGPPPNLNAPLLFLTSAWAASQGVWALMRGVFRVHTGKWLGPWPARLAAVGFTLGFAAVLSGTVALLAGGQWAALLGALGAVYLLLLGLYTLIPGMKASPRRASVAAAAGAAGWLVLSRGFELYMREIGRYTLLYGSVGAFLGLALWLYCLALWVLLGAALARGPRSRMVA